MQKKHKGVSALVERNFWSVLKPIAYSWRYMTLTLIDSTVFFCYLDMPHYIWRFSANKTNPLVSGFIMRSFGCLIATAASRVYSGTCDPNSFQVFKSYTHTVILEYFNIKEKALFNFAFQSFCTQNKNIFSNAMMRSWNNPISPLLSAGLSTWII